MPIANQIVRYASSSVFKRLLGIFYAFIKPKLLTPEMLGLWSLLALLPRYSVFADLGTRAGMRFQLPLLRARGDHAGSDQTQASVLLGTLATYGVVAAVLGVFAIIWNGAPEIRWGLATMAVVVLLRWYSGYRRTLVKAREQFPILSRANYLQAILTVSLGVPGLLWMGIYGLFLSLLLAEAVLCLYLGLGDQRFPPGRFSRERFVELIQKGAPIMAFNLFTLAIRSVDRVIVVAMLGLQQMGFYALAVTLFSLLVQIPGAGREVMEPNLMRRSVAIGNDELVRDHLFSPLIHSAALMPFLIGPVLFLLPPILPVLLPRYEASVAPAQVLALASYFMALVFASRGLIVSRGLQLPALVVLGGALLVNVLTTQALLSLGLGLVGAGIGSLLALIGLYGGLYLFIQRRVANRIAGAEWFEVFLASLLPILLTLGLFLALRQAGLADSSTELLPGIVGWLLHGLAMLGLLYLDGRHFSGLRLPGRARRA